MTVKNGQERQILPMRYESGALSALGLEILTFEELRTMRAGTESSPVIRADFHVLASCTDGNGRLRVDFAAHPFGAGDLAWIRPGWTHRWDDITDVQGSLVLLRPEFVSTAIIGADPPGMLVSPMSKTTPLITEAIEHLRSEYAAVEIDPLLDSARILRNLLEVILLRTRAGQHFRATGEVFDAFARAVEAHHHESRELSWYASELGYSARTLSRASHAAAGMSAKQFIDDRVILEAKRLLVHGDLTTTECARRLGFDDPANFAKFFRTRTATSPGRFKAAA
ncbi:AraC family transcriptional regulator [Nocardia sp. NPDC006630]|uniref:AraC family transcriptional regulator n=1 Tax=Nocardia sp. NPDC006630 TaxID=3157181 RepID=UPI0033A5748F